MKCQNCGPCLGKLVHQLPKVITLAYNLRLAIKIPHFEDLKDEDEIEQVNWFGSFLDSLFSLKTYFSPSKWL